MRFVGVQGIVYDQDNDVVKHDLNRAYPHVKESDRFKLADRCAALLNNAERDSREVQRIMQGNVGVL